MMYQHKRIEQCTEHGQHWVTCLDCGAQWHDTDPPEQVTEGDGSCDDQGTASHWSYGGGSSGCLYDFGPEFAATRDDAIEALGAVYDLTDPERALLELNGFVEFDTTPGSAVDTVDDMDAGATYRPSRRNEVGADYCELEEHSGPCPEPEDIEF